MGAIGRRTVERARYRRSILPPRNHQRLSDNGVLGANYGWPGLLFHRSLRQLPDGSIAGTMYGNYQIDHDGGPGVAAPDYCRVIWVKSSGAAIRDAIEVVLDSYQRERGLGPRNEGPRSQKYKEDKPKRPHESIRTIEAHSCD